MVDKLNGVGRYWWMYLVLGILACILGLSFFANLGFAITTVTLIAGIYFLVSGIFGAITAIVDRKFISLWGLHLVLHIFVILAGIALLTRPAFALSFIWILCGVGFMFDGIAMIVTSISLKKLNVDGWVLTLIFGILIVLAAFAIMGNPILGLIVVAVSAACGALFFGISNIVLAFKLKKIK